MARISYCKRGGKDVFGTLAEGMIALVHFLSGMMNMRMMIISEMRKKKPTGCLLPCACLNYHTF